jgi:N-acetylneuraminic acid mutarotase
MKNFLRFNAFVLGIILCFNFNTANAAWEVLENLENPNPFPVMAAADGKIYLLSGAQGGSIATHEYDPETDSWAIKASMPNACIYSSAESVNGKIYVMGGGQSNQKKDIHYIYDPAADTWTEGAPLLTPRMYHSSGNADGKIYLIGGQNGDGTTEWYFDEYDPVDNTWLRKTNSPHKDAWYCGAVGIGHNFYRIGGGRWNVPTNHFDVYYAETDSWEELPTFPIGVHAPAAVNFQDKILVMGGYNNEQKIDSIYMYNPESLTMNYMPEPMGYHKAVTLGNYVYVYSKSEDGQYGRLWRYKYGTTEVEDNITVSTDDINIYPNPCTGIFSIKGDFGALQKAEIKVFNSLGKQVYSNTETFGTGKELFIELENPASGVYMVQMIINGKAISKKLIIYG